MDKPEALRLADAIEKAIRPEASLPLGDWARAAAELRRLHAENEALRNVANRGGHIAVAISEIDRLQAQRDALLEALRLMMDCAGDIATAPDSMLEMALNYDDEETRRQANAFLVARAAIKAVEEAK